MGRNGTHSNLIGTIVFIFVFYIVVSAAGATEILDVQVSESIDVSDFFNGSLTSGDASGSGQITIKNTLSSTDLYDVNISFNNGTTSSSTWSSSSSGVYLDTSNSAFVQVHINYLGHGDSVAINYDCSGSRPVTFNESYSANKILVNDSTDVNLEIERNIDSTISSITFTKVASDSNINSVADFRFSDASANLGAVTNPSEDTVMWTVSELNSSVTNATLTFTATENDSAAHIASSPQSAQEMFLGNGTLQFTVNNGVQSGNNVSVIGAPIGTTLNFMFDLQKNQLDSSEGGSGGDDWGFTPTITNTDTESIDYTVSAVTMYVTTSSSLDYSSAVETSVNSSVGTLSQSDVWTQDEWKIYDFPEPVPVGWLDVNLSVDLTGSQLTESYLSINGTYEIIEKIYIINGYLVEARKTITKNDTDSDYYDISLWVHNKGDLATPPTVVVYDIIPQGFTNASWVTDPDGSTSVLSPVTGTAYWWDVGALQADRTAGNQTYVNYTVEGNSDVYRLTDLFILGIDPAYSLNMQTTPVLRTGANVATRNDSGSLIGMMSMMLFMVGIVGNRRNKRN
ncbi:hypothetical protein V7O67_10325 [Methanolobus sp. ZRKC4]|uniref:hypothetical protein n=1 Tax=Methanolobus sp. ZRKC4 TaxID=3125787 RepID=UPI00324BD5DF